MRTRRSSGRPHGSDAPGIQLAQAGGPPRDPFPPVHPVGLESAQGAGPRLAYAAVVIDEDVEPIGVEIVCKPRIISAPNRSGGRDHNHRVSGITMAMTPDEAAKYDVIRRGKPHRLTPALCCDVPRPSATCLLTHAVGSDPSSSPIHHPRQLIFSMLRRCCRMRMPPHDVRSLQLRRRRARPFLVAWMAGEAGRVSWVQS